MARARHLGDRALDLVAAFNEYLSHRPGKMELREQMYLENMYITMAPKTYREPGDIDPRSQMGSQRKRSEADDGEKTSEEGNAILIEYIEAAKCLEKLALYLDTAGEMRETGWVIIDTKNRDRRVADGQIEVIL